MLGRALGPPARGEPAAQRVLQRGGAAGAGGAGHASSSDSTAFSSSSLVTVRSVTLARPMT